MMGGLLLLVYKTKLGIAMRATSQNQQVAGLMGIDINRVISLTFVIGAALGAVAGVMVGSYYGIAHYQMGFILGLKAFSAAVLGGIGNLAGRDARRPPARPHRGARRRLRRRPHEPVQPVGMVRRARRSAARTTQPDALRLQLPGRVRIPGADRGAHFPTRRVYWANASPTARNRERDVHPVACRGCDLLQRLPALRAGRQGALAADATSCSPRIPRIRSTGRSRSRSPAAIVVVIANVAPLMSLSVGGTHVDHHARRRRLRDVAAGKRSHRGDRRVLRRARAGAVRRVRCCSCCSPCSVPPAPSWTGDAHAPGPSRLRPWSMNEVLLLGILVALTKIAELATVTPGVGMFAVGALVLSAAVARQHVRFARACGSASRGSRPKGIGRERESRGGIAGSSPATTAGCVARPRSRAAAGALPALRRRASNGGTTTRSQRTWAFLIAAAILYVPANILPVLTTNTLVSSRDGHDHVRRGLPLHVRLVAARADRARRERDDPARQDHRARLRARHACSAAPR